MRAGDGGRAGGFVLLVTLLLLALLSGFILVTLDTRRGDELATSAYADSSKDLASRQAGLALAIAALDAGILHNGSNRLPPLAVNQRSVNAVVRIGGGRVDANAAPDELIEAAIGLMRAPEIVDDVRQHLRAAKASGQMIPSPAALLAPCLRLTDALPMVESWLRTGTTDPTVSRSEAPRELLAALPGMSPLALHLIEADRHGSLVLSDDPRIATVTKYLGEPGRTLQVSLEVENRVNAPRGQPARFLADLAVPRNELPILTRLEDRSIQLPRNYCL